MADICDDADRATEAFLNAGLKNASVPIDPGAPGDCEMCGEWSGRLVNGVCAPCRDKYKLP